MSRRWPLVLFGSCLLLCIFLALGFNTLILAANQWRPPEGVSLGADMTNAALVGLFLGFPVSLGLVLTVALVRLLLRALARTSWGARWADTWRREPAPEHREGARLLGGLAGGLGLSLMGGLAGGVLGLMGSTVAVLYWLFGPQSQQMVQTGWSTPLAVIFTPVGAVYGTLIGLVLGLAAGALLALVLSWRRRGL